MDTALEGRFQAALWELTGVEVLWGEGISCFGVSVRLRRGLAHFPQVAPGTKSVRTSGDRASMGIENSSQNGALTLQSLLRGIRSPEPAKSQGDSRLKVHPPSSEATGMPQSHRSIFRDHREPKGARRTPMLVSLIPKQSCTDEEKPGGFKTRSST